MTKTVFDVFTANKLIEQERYEEAGHILRDLYDQAIENDEPIYYISYRIAVCEYYGANFEEALGWLDMALQNDPYNAHCTSLEYSIFDEIVRKIEYLMDQGPEPDEIARLYNLCYERGQINSHLQFLMINYFMKKRDFKKAKPLIENALGRNPNDKELMTFRLDIAKREKDEKVIEEILGKLRSTRESLFDIKAVQ